MSHTYVLVWRFCCYVKEGAIIAGRSKCHMAAFRVEARGGNTIFYRLEEVWYI